MTRPCSGRAKGAPKASSSAPVRAQPGPGASPPVGIKSGRLTYSAEELIYWNLPTGERCLHSILPDNMISSCTHYHYRLCPSLSRVDIPLPKRTVKMLLLNCRSLPKHSTEIRLLLELEQPDVLFLTETWLNGDSDPAVVQALPPEYGILRRDRDKSRRGGLAIVYKIGLNCCITMSPLPDCESFIFAITFGPTSTFSGILIYRPPGPYGNFCSNILDSISNLASTLPNFTVLGDLNLHFEDTTHSTTKYLIEGLSTLQLALKSNSHTHCSGHLLDPVFSNLEHLLVEEPHTMLWTDHFLVLFTWTLLCPPPPVAITKVQARPWSKLPLQTWDTLFQDTRPKYEANPLIANDNLNAWLESSLNSVLPKKLMRNKEGVNRNPWYSPKLRELKQIWKQQERKWRKGFSSTNKENYREAIRTYKKEIKHAQACYFEEKIIPASSSSHETFHILKSLLSCKVMPTIVNDPKARSNKMAEFFLTK